MSDIGISLDLESDDGSVPGHIELNAQWLEAFTAEPDQLDARPLWPDWEITPEAWAVGIRLLIDNPARPASTWIDRILYGVSYTLNGERIDPKEVGTGPPE